MFTSARRGHARYISFSSRFHHPREIHSTFWNAYIFGSLGICHAGEGDVGRVYNVGWRQALLRSRLYEIRALQNKLHCELMPTFYLLSIISTSRLIVITNYRKQLFRIFLVKSGELKSREILFEKQKKLIQYFRKIQ